MDVTLVKQIKELKQTNANLKKEHNEAIAVRLEEFKSWKGCTRKALLTK